MSLVPALLLLALTPLLGVSATSSWVTRAGGGKALSVPCESFNLISGNYDTSTVITDGIPGTPSPGEVYTVSISGITGSFRLVDDPSGTHTLAGPTSLPGTLTYSVPATPSTSFGVGYYIDSGAGTYNVTASCKGAAVSTALPAPVVISKTISGAPTTKNSTHTALSANGSSQVFESQETDLVASNSQIANGQDIYRVVNGVTVLENKSSSGQLLGTSSLPAISQDGNVVAFLYNTGTSQATAKDLITGQMYAGNSGQNKHQVDKGMGGAAPNGPASGAPSVSSNGTKKLVFCSAASNLVNGDSNGTRDVFLVDPTNVNSTPQRISTDSTGAQIAGDSCDAKISADGSKVAFTVSAASMFGTAARQVVRKDLNTGVLELLSPSKSGGGKGANADSSEPSISGDGGVVAFTSAASDLDGLGTPAGGSEVFISIAQDGADGTPRVIERARSADGIVPNNSSLHPQISNDGTVVVMQTLASNFFGGKAATPSCGAVAISTNFFSPTLLGSSLCNGQTKNQNPTISGDGTMAGFDSNAPQTGTASSNSNAYAQNAGAAGTGVPNLSGDYSGQWFDPNQSGQGIVVDVIHPDANNNRAVLLTWFVYVGGQPTWVQGAGVPKAGSGDKSGSVIVQMDQVGIFQGKSFPLGQATATGTLWGSITLTFTNANNGTMSWTSSYPGFSNGSMPITHFLPVGLPSQDAAGAKIRACYSGNWFNPAQSGHGFEFEVIPANPPVLAIDWFAFGPNGAPVWLQGAGSVSGNSATMQLQLIDGAGAQFPPNYNPATISQHVWGTATFTFTDASHATVSWNSSLPGYGSGSQPLQPTLGQGLLDRRTSCQ